MVIYRVVTGQLAILVLLSGAVPADKPEQKTARLVEVHSMPRCYGLDCPPWLVAPDIDFCFQADASYYTGISRPWSVPWATKAEKLMALEDRPVEILVTDKRIIALTPRIKLNLQRVHSDPVFRLAACTQT